MPLAAHPLQDLKENLLCTAGPPGDKEVHCVPAPASSSVSPKDFDEEATKDNNF